MTLRVIFFGNSQNVLSRRFHESIFQTPCYIAAVVDVPPARRMPANPDADTGKVTVRDILVDGKKMLRQGQPTWRLAPDGRTSYLIGVSDPTL